VEFETEEQQVEAIKKWFAEYGLTIIAGLVLGLVGIFGYRYYQEEKESQLAQTSDAYESVIQILRVQKDQEKFVAEAATFNSEHSDSIYSNLVSFQLAKLAVDADDLGTAAQHLRDILSTPHHSTIEHIARIRLARVLIAQEEVDEALTLIAQAVGDSYQSSYEMLRGDVWLFKGDKARAQKAYAAAKSHSNNGASNPNLEMLLTDLAEQTSKAEAE
jgi:predicted negative regulator of RcsB-dependent stress response